eukprot:TRINITY_DN1878_c0_g1_i1.p1 TRINITY_DN1878_c0_g1~~TRINITY_DN1878_c0_g1_i1.p1  ORF type:complete len:225 (-),score=-21.32 TRINITY_DN1878_c0_g1_i1:265-939(-)
MYCYLFNYNQIIPQIYYITYIYNLYLILLTQYIIPYCIFSCYIVSILVKLKVIYQSEICSLNIFLFSRQKLQSIVFRSVNKGSAFLTFQVLLKLTSYSQQIRNQFWQLLFLYLFILDVFNSRANVKTNMILTPAKAYYVKCGGSFGVTIGTSHLFVINNYYLMMFTIYLIVIGRFLFLCIVLLEESLTLVFQLFFICQQQLIVVVIVVVIQFIIITFICLFISQ